MKVLISYGIKRQFESCQSTGAWFRTGGPFCRALYAARAELAPVVLTGIQLGGQAALTYTVENYPGFPEGVGGAQLGELFQKQAEHFGAKVEFDTANEVDLSQRPFKVTTDNGEYLADTLIVATGASSNQLGSSRRKRTDRPRRFLLRHLRWLVLQGQEGRRRRRRRQRARGRPVHHALCLLGHHRPPPRRTCAPVRCCRSAPASIPK